MSPTTSRRMAPPNHGHPQSLVLMSVVVNDDSIHSEAAGAAKVDASQWPKATQRELVAS